MISAQSRGRQFAEAVNNKGPLQVVGVVNAYCAKLAERAGFKALYVSGGGVAAASYGLPDLGITTMDDVLIDVRRIADATTLPILVDIDTGWGNALNIARTIRSMIAAGAAAVHIEDQVQAKRCGHRPRKSIVPTDEMVDRVRAAVDAKTDADFVIMARTDALAAEGISGVIDRAAAYVEAGADIIFPEAVLDLATYRQIANQVRVPIIANITEFGLTPMFTVQELSDAGVKLVLYPLSAFRAMSKAALYVYETIKAEGSQQSVLSGMQTRQDLYRVLDYESYESQLDMLFGLQR